MKFGAVVSHAMSTLTEKIDTSHYEEAGQTIYIKAGMSIVIEAGAQISLKGPGGFVDIGPAGVTIQGTMVLINSGGAAGSGTTQQAVSPLEPDKAEIADNADPGSDAPSYKQQRRETPPALVPSYSVPTHKPKSPNNKDKKSWVEIELLDGTPLTSRSVKSEDIFHARLAANRLGSVRD